MAYSAESLAHELAQKIVRREIAPNGAMPTIRALSDSYAVNVTTAQRAVDRLIGTGMARKISAKQIVAIDFERDASVDTVGHVLSMARQMPHLATHYVDDLLALHIDTTLIVLREIIENHREAFLTLAVVRLEEITAHSDVASLRPQVIAEQEFHIYQELARLIGRPVVLSLLNTIGTTIMGRPELVEVLFPDPARLANSWRLVIEAVRAGVDGTTLLQTVEHYLNERRRRHVAIYRQHVCGDLEVS